MKKWTIFICIFVVLVLGLIVVVKNKSEQCNLTSYNQILIYDDQRQILEGKEEVCFFNYTDNALTQLWLHLYPNAFRQGAKAKVVSLSNYEKAYPNGISYGNITIETVSYCDDYLEYEITGEDENILNITIPELYPDETITFEIGFSCQLPNINHRFGYGENTINLGNYYPIMCVYENGEFKDDMYYSNGDPFYSKTADYNVSITYDESFVLASTGEQETTIKDGRKTTNISAKNVRDFAMVLSNKFDAICDEYDNINIRYYYYEDENSDEIITLIKEVLDFNKRYGKYPYNELSVVKANFVHGGMEFPQMVLISDVLSDRDTYINVVVHELCHQWWYGVVGNDEVNFGFLDEGLTDYTTARFYDYYSKYNHTSTEIFENATRSYANFVKVYGDVKQNFSTNMIRPLGDFETENEYVYISYVKGMLMFASLQDLLGQKKIDGCLKYYYDCNKFSECKPDDLVDAFNKSSGKNLTKFFDSWFNGEVVMGEF